MYIYLFGDFVLGFIIKVHVLIREKMKRLHDTFAGNSSKTHGTFNRVNVLMKFHLLVLCLLFSAHFFKIAYTKIGQH